MGPNIKVRKLTDLRRKQLNCEISLVGDIPSLTLFFSHCWVETALPKKWEEEESSSEKNYTIFFFQKKHSFSMVCD